MWNWLTRLFGRSTENPPPIDDRLLEREAQGLRLELQERDQTIANLKQELQRQRSCVNTPVTEPVLALEREAQGLRLELQERDQTIVNLKQELERQRSNFSNHVSEAAQLRVEQLLGDVAAPIAQLLTQANLLEVVGRPVQARDVVAVAKRLVRILQDNGLSLEGSVGQILPFDPDYHQLLSTGASLTPGQPVVLRFVGVTYQGKLLRRADVEKAED